MTTIAIECGGTIDKFIGDAVMVFFGDPNTEGEPGRIEMCRNGCEDEAACQ